MDQTVSRLINIIVGVLDKGSMAKGPKFIGPLPSSCAE